MIVSAVAFEVEFEVLKKIMLHILNAFFLHLKCTMCSYSQQLQIEIFKLVGRGEDGGAHLGPERRGGWP